MITSVTNLRIVFSEANTTAEAVDYFSHSLCYARNLRGLVGKIAHRISAAVTNDINVLADRKIEPITVIIVLVLLVPTVMHLTYLAAKALKL